MPTDQPQPGGSDVAPVPLKPPISVTVGTVCALLIAVGCLAGPATTVWLRQRDD